MSSVTLSASPSEEQRVESVVSSLQAGPTASKPTYCLVQMLRALAALMVVGHHATIMLWERDRLPVANWLAGSSGVDIFFVISGFVMTISSAPLLRRAAHPARTFLARRIERIVPMYYIVTTAKILVLLLFPALGLSGLGNWQHIATSYLFLPSFSAEGRLEPVLVVGWTLNFEMAFYALFATALGLRTRPILLLAPILLLVPLIPLSIMWHIPFPLWFYRSTQTWEFLMGMLLGLGVQHVRRIPWGVGLALLLAGLLPLLFWNHPGVAPGRGYLWGVPAAAVLLGAVSMERRWGSSSPSWALELGDASYSIYLVHTFVLPAIGLWLKRWTQPWPGEVPLCLTGAVILSAIAGVLAYRGLERPMMLWFRGRRRTAIPANA